MLYHLKLDLYFKPQVVPLQFRTRFLVRRARRNPADSNTSQVRSSCFIPPIPRLKTSVYFSLLVSDLNGLETLSIASSTLASRNSVYTGISSVPVVLP